MSTPETPSDSDPREAARSASHKRPWGWITVAGLLAAGVVGLGIYAVNLNSDLDDANAKVASQQKQIDEAQDTGAGVVAAAKKTYDDLSTKLGAAQQDASQAVEQASGKLDEAEQAAADAKGTAEELQKEAVAARAKANAAATCAQSFLSAFRGVFSGSTLREGVQAAVTELQALQPQCASALSSSS
jgi:chromosome segregation ATPase